MLNGGLVSRRLLHSLEGRNPAKHPHWQGFPQVTQLGEDFLRSLSSDGFVIMLNSPPLYQYLPYK